MTEARPDTDEHREPGGTPSPGPADLTDRPLTPGTDDDGGARAVPGAYEADDADRERGKAVKPGG
ncbi:hypothetical protein E9549_07555 [Blastococcus sp. MG754426]|uniref:hypothetical protein n=1 Tax=unclassified Blastococcus TaxID=2619396 RepID=UPI001EEF7B75|nr:MULTISPECIES: hypothetical protein [unclassified Blastococcus]MCF6507263.1 hypothetical protein [Blastococcus sp. MG754426]MCF6511885.1 hypothetical protein [Blastococcus sp. MG754427]MCF6734150.1 hypothetical protein [Blastococcus sp. KM273129]